MVKNDTVKPIQHFRELTDENWRNSFYIACTACRFEKPDGCGDFLFVPDETGRPLLLPVHLAKEAFEQIDWSECLGRMSNLMFCELYRRWLCSRAAAQDECPLLGCAEDPINRRPEGSR